MTFSNVARCPRTGEYGVGIATYPPNVGVRCPAVVPQRDAAAPVAVLLIDSVIVACAAFVLLPALHKRTGRLFG